MPQYQLLTCRIALSGDVGNVVVRSFMRPITYPELIVLGVLHGETSISMIEDVGNTEERDRNEEFARLGHVYGEQIIKTLFPGHSINLPERNDRYPKGAVPAPSETADEIDPQIALNATTQMPKRVSART